MNHIKLHLFPHELQVFSEWLRAALVTLESRKARLTVSDRCAYACMLSFYMNKVHPKTVGIRSEISLKFDEASAHAFLFIYFQFPIPIDTQIGNTLRMFADHIDQLFK